MKYLSLIFCSIFLSSCGYEFTQKELDFLTLVDEECKKSYELKGDRADRVIHFNEHSRFDLGEKLGMKCGDLYMDFKYIASDNYANVDKRYIYSRYYDMTVYVQEIEYPLSDMNSSELRDAIMNRIHKYNSSKHEKTRNILKLRLKGSHL